MPRHPRTVLGTLALLLLAPAFGRAQSGADLIPDDAAVAVVINSIAGVRDKGEKYIADNDLKFEKEQRPSALFTQVFDLIGVKKGVDEKGAAAVVLPSLTKNKVDKLDFRALMLLYAAVPVADVEKMASNWDLKAADLKKGQPIRLSDGPLGKAWVLLKGKHLYYGLSEKALALVPDAKPVTGELSGEQKAAMSKADLALLLGADALGPIFADMLNDLEKNMKRADDADNAQSKEFVGALRQMRFAVGGLSLDDGGKITAIATFNKGKDGETARKWLTALRAGPGTSDLVGLPAMAPWMAYAAKGDGVSNVEMTRALVNIIFDQNSIDRVLPGKERRELVAAFETMYRELKGSRAALYPTADAKKFGQFGFVGILDLGDVEKHLDEWTTMAKLLTRAAERAYPDSKRKPQLVYQPKADTLDGDRLDLFTVTMPDLTEQQEKDLKEAFGPEWNKVRLAVEGKHAVVLLGSDVDLLRQTLTNLKKGNKGLAEEKVTVGELARVSPERKIEFHFNLRNLRRYYRGDKPEPVKGLTSFALTIETDRLQLEIVAAKSEVKPFAAFLGLADD